MIYLGSDPVGIFNGVNELSQHEKITLTFPSASNSNAWANGAIVPVSFIPKFIVFYGGNSETSGNIIRGCFAIDISGKHIYAGSVYYKNLANGNLGYGAYAYSVDAAAAHFKYDTGYFYATRISSNGYWSNTDSYTFEFYG